MKIWPGKPYPLGATWDGGGVNFALFSEYATKVDLCLFGPPGSQETETVKIAMTEKTDQVWHVYIPETVPGQLYGFRVHGPYNPSEGLRFNPAKLLLDPYAKAIGGDIAWDDALFGYIAGNEDADLSRDLRDSAPFVPKSIVIDPAFSWDGDTLLEIPWSETLIYEVHVKGFTKLHPDILPDQRGTYAGMASPPAIDYLKSLGVTAVELMPVHHFVTDRTMIDRGLSNYWGYSTIGFFAPHALYSSSGVFGEQVTEFKSMVRTMHQNGIEVILDVVYNHTAEGNQMGPTLCFRGIDNRSYYHLSPKDLRYYMDFTGTGNTPNMMSPRVLQMIMDSLRYWVEDMHVDGFRFDLASSLARELYEVDRLGAFFDIIHQDPVLARVKLIAEPWDLGPGGYQVGNFPALWAEWNGKYRDTVRKYWRGDPGQKGDLAYRLTGSSDLYERSGKRPYASINFVVSHDGFTLHDLVSYNEKHNEANKEGNHDGMDENYSWNCGMEGGTNDRSILGLRDKQARNFLATVLLSEGVPMICHGDEIGRTQCGNNNAYCQDNEISWINWELDTHRKDLLEFTKYVIKMFHEHPVFKLKHYFQGRKIRGSEFPDLSWFRPDGKLMQEDDWNDESRCFGMRLAGDALNERDEQGNPIWDDTFLLIFNSWKDPVPFTLPEHKPGQQWELVLDTRSNTGRLQHKPLNDGDAYEVDAHSMAVLSVKSLR